MRLKIIAWIFALIAATATGRAATTTDLGQGLNYLRVHTFALDEAALTTALSANNALVLDLRYCTAAEANADAFYRVLGKHTGPAPLFILVSPETPAPLAEILAASSVKFITLGVKGSLPAPKVLVTQTPATDRRAYDALESNMPLKELVSGKIEKPRYDEASLMNDFRNGNTNAEPPEAEAPDKKDDGNAKVPALTDRVLQRAINLHSALSAVKPR